MHTYDKMVEKTCDLNKVGAAHTAICVPSTPDHYNRDWTPRCLKSFCRRWGTPNIGLVIFRFNNKLRKVSKASTSLCSGCSCDSVRPIQSLKLCPCLLSQVEDTGCGPPEFQVQQKTEEVKNQDQNGGHYGESHASVWYNENIIIKPSNHLADSQGPSQITWIFCQKGQFTNLLLGCWL